MKRSSDTVGAIIKVIILIVVLSVGIPYIIKNLNERKWVSQRKNMYVTLLTLFTSNEPLNKFVDAQTFVDGRLKTPLKISKVCSSENLAECDLENPVFTPLGSDIEMKWATSWRELWIDSPYAIGTLYGYVGNRPVQMKDLVAGFSTENGETAMVYYNPNCVPDARLFANNPRLTNGSHNLFNYVCMNLVYDLNGAKSPNKIGKDQGFFTVFYPKASIVVAPVASTTLSNTRTCGVEADSYRIPNRYEAASMVLNNYYIAGVGLGDSTKLNSATKVSLGKSTYFYYINGHLSFSTSKDDNMAGLTRCVKR